jgi:hypothetical protein
MKAISRQRSAISKLNRGGLAVNPEGKPQTSKRAKSALPPDS